MQISLASFIIFFFGKYVGYDHDLAKRLGRNPTISFFSGISDYAGQTGVKSLASQFVEN